MKPFVSIVGRGKVPSKKNKMKLSNRGGKVRTYKDPSVSLFENDLKMLARIEMKGRKPTSKPVSMSLNVIMGDRRRRDLQNCFGSVCDALNDIVYEDDCQIELLIGIKTYKKNRWGYEIKITEIDDE